MKSSCQIITMSACSLDFFAEWMAVWKFEELSCPGSTIPATMPPQSQQVQAAGQPAAATGNGQQQQRNESWTGTIVKCVMMFFFLKQFFGGGAKKPQPNVQNRHDMYLPKFNRSQPMVSLMCWSAVTLQISFAVLPAVLAAVKPKCSDSAGLCTLPVREQLLGRWGAHLEQAGCATGHRTRADHQLLVQALQGGRPCCELTMTRSWARQSCSRKEAKRLHRGASSLAVHTQQMRQAAERHWSPCWLVQAWPWGLS